MTKNDHWLVVMTKPKMESVAKEHLIRQGFETYLPALPRLRQKRNEWKKIREPMFPRYLFFRCTDIQQSLASVRSTRGVSHLVKFGTEVAFAKADLIKDIYSLEQHYFQQEKNLSPFSKEDQVQIVDGPFKGITAEVFSCNESRVILLFQLLGKQQLLTFETSMCRNI